MEGTTESKEDRYKKALEIILNYHDYFEVKFIINYAFKKFAIDVVKKALSDDPLPLPFKSNSGV